MVSLVWDTLGAINATTIIGKFGLELNGAARSNRKSRYTIRGGSLFSAGPVRSRLTIPFDLSDPFSTPVPQCSVLSMVQHGEKRLCSFCELYIHVQVYVLYMFYVLCLMFYALCFVHVLCFIFCTCRFWLLRTICFSREFLQFFSLFETWWCLKIFELNRQISGSGLLKITRYSD